MSKLVRTRSFLARFMENTAYYFLTERACVDLAKEGGTRCYTLFVDYQGNVEFRTQSAKHHTDGVPVDFFLEEEDEQTSTD